MHAKRVSTYGQQANKVEQRQQRDQLEEYVGSLKSKLYQFGDKKHKNGHPDNEYGLNQAKNVNINEGTGGFGSSEEEPDPAKMFDRKKSSIQDVEMLEKLRSYDKYNAKLIEIIKRRSDTERRQEEAAEKIVNYRDKLSLKYRIRDIDEISANSRQKEELEYNQDFVEELLEMPQDFQESSSISKTVSGAQTATLHSPTTPQETRPASPRRAKEEEGDASFSHLSLRSGTPVDTQAQPKEKNKDPAQPTYGEETVKIKPKNQFNTKRGLFAMDTPITSLQQDLQHAPPSNSAQHPSFGHHASPEAPSISHQSDTDAIFNRLKEPKIRRKKHERIASTSPAKDSLPSK